MPQNYPILEEVQALNLQTIPGGKNAIFKLRTDVALTYRLFRNYQYIKDIRCPTQRNVHDISLRVLLCAYIYGTWNVNKRAASRLSELDEMIDYDRKFYDGLWDILTTIVTGSPKPKLTPLSSFDEVSELYYDEELNSFSIKDSCDEYVMFCVINNIKMTNRGFSRLVGLVPNFLELHPTSKAKDGRREPTKPLLEYLFGVIKCKNDNEIAPPDFWINNINTAWLYLQQSLINDLYLADEFHKEYIAREFG